METLTTKELETKQQIEKLEKIILSRFSEFAGDIGNFKFFLKDAIEAKLHAWMTTESDLAPDFKDFQNIMYNVDLLREAIDATQEIQYLESELEKEKQV